MSADRPADRIRKLVSMAASAPSPETNVARIKATVAIRDLDTELLDTLASQRAQLLEELREESRRLMDARERATKTDTGELVSRASLLLGHYERVDALLAVVLFLRVEGGFSLSNEERQRLDGPQEDFLSGWRRASRERRKAERAERRARRRATS